MSDWATCQQEARHVIATYFVGGSVESAAVGVHAGEEGIVKVGPLRNGCADLVTRLVGWAGDPHLPERALWPPPYSALNTKHDADGVGWCVKHHGISEATYDAVVEIVEALIADPAFVAATNLIARGLMRAPLLDAKSLELLKAQTAFAEPEPIGAPV